MISEEYFSNDIKLDYSCIETYESIYRLIFRQLKEDNYILYDTDEIDSICREKNKDPLCPFNFFSEYFKSKKWFLGISSATSELMKESIIYLVKNGYLSIRVERMEYINREGIHIKTGDMEISIGPIFYNPN